MLVPFQVKFQVYTPQKSWNLFFPRWKMLLPRMDSLDHSTTTFPTVHTLYRELDLSVYLCSIILFVSILTFELSFWLLSAFSVEKFSTCLISLHCYMYLTQFLCLPATYCCMHKRNSAMSLRLRLTIQINYSIIVKVNPLRAACSSSLSKSVREKQAKQCHLQFWIYYNSPFFLPVFVYCTPLGIQQNLHIILIMDCSNSTFTINCESNPAFYRRCSVQWMEGWSESSMKKVSVRGGVK